MEEARILLVDLDPLSDLGFNLKEILESSKTPQIRLKQESIALGKPDLLERAISGPISDFNPNLILLILPSACAQQVCKLTQWICGKPNPSPVMAIIGGDRPEDLMDLLRSGVADFVTPPLKPIDVLPRLWRLLRREPQEEARVRALKESIGLRQLVGKSPCFVVELDKIPLVAKCNATVLISGETGTGKELFARAIHYLGPRSDKPFVPVSCGAIPVDLVENELFGHARGAFTGAATATPGLIQESSTGTLFLDEIDCLPLLAQVKLLRFIQDKEYRQLGSTKARYCDVRVMAASNLDLEKAVSEGKFRPDLFYRLNVILFTLPPLRERGEDILLLARHFLDKFTLEFHKPIREFTSQAVQKLLAYDWPGNVRELENAIERAVVFSKETTVQSADMVLSSMERPAPQESFKAAKSMVIERFEKSYIQSLLSAYQGNITKAAHAARKNRRAFWELIRKHGIDAHNIKPASISKVGQSSTLP